MARTLEVISAGLVVFRRYLSNASLIETNSIARWRIVAARILV